MTVSRAVTKVIRNRTVPITRKTVAVRRKVSARLSEALICGARTRASSRIVAPEPTMRPEASRERSIGFWLIAPASEPYGMLTSE